jgi:hypothetical protein
LKPLREVVTQDEADAWLGDCCARLEAWAISVGHDAKNFIVPKWAQPLPKKIPSVLRVDGQPKEEDPVLLELPVRVKQKSRTSSAAKNARKAQREAYLAAQAKVYLK